MDNLGIDPKNLWFHLGIDIKNRGFHLGIDPKNLGIEVSKILGSEPAN